MRPYLLVVALTCIVIAACGPAAEQPQATIETGTASSDSGRLLKLEELSHTDIDAIDRSRSIVFITFGNLEEHGPHLPVGTDYYVALGIRDGLIAKLQQTHPDYDLLIYPVVPLAVGGANDMARQFDHVGSFDVRFETQRNVAIDLCASFARQGFKNIFLVHGHGAPLHSVAFNEAAAFVNERYEARIVNITSLVYGQGPLNAEILPKHLGEDWAEKLGWERHGGASETSEIVYLREDLVKPEHKQYEPFLVKDRAGFLRTYERTGWQGYWGAPALSSKALGEELIANLAERAYGIAEKALSGEDLSSLPVYPHMLPGLPEDEAHTQMMLERYREQTAEIEAWLRERNLPK